MKRIDISELKKRIWSIAEKYKISYSLLFGSFAKGTAKEGSDIDIAIKVKNLEKSEILDFLKKFVTDLDMDNVDVVILNFAPFSVTFDALTEGKVLFCKDEDELIEDRIRVLKLYDDWVHIARHFERVERERVRT